MLKKILAAAVALLFVAACQTKPTDTSGANAMGGAHGAVVPGSQADLEANVGDRVFFAFDSSVLSTEAQDTLGRQAEWLKKNASVSVSVEGHSDERGTREYNLALGERRANAAKKFLTAAGIEANRISTISYGKERPAVVGSNEEAWGQNRRAVTVVNQ